MSAKTPRSKAAKATKQKAELSAGLVERALVDQQRAELRASQLDNVNPEENGASGGRARLAFSAIEAAYAKDPMVFGGINKKASDITKKWHVFESADPSADDPDPEIVRKLVAFERRVNLRQVATQAVLDSILYGDSYTERVTEKDNGNGKLPLTPGRIVELPRVVPSTILPVREKAQTAEHGRLKHYRQQSGGRIVEIHPSRIERLTFATLGDDQRGLGAVEAAIRTIVAKEKGDNAAGDQLAWYAKGLVTLALADATTEELEETYKAVLRARKDGSNVLVGSDRHAWTVHNAAVVNPQPWNDAFYYNLASALAMPKDVLIGASAGAITGSETNLRDYYEACDAFLQTKLTPWLERLYALELGVSVEDLPVRVVWNPLYVNEETEAKTRFTNAQSASIAFRDRVITGNEYRAVLGYDPLDGLDELPKESFAFPGMDDGSKPEREAMDPADELRKLAGDTAG